MESLSCNTSSGYIVRISIDPTGLRAISQTTRQVPQLPLVIGESIFYLFGCGGEQFIGESKKPLEGIRLSLCSECPSPWQEALFVYQSYIGHSW